MYFLPHSLQSPPPKDTVTGVPVGQIVRHRTPRTTGAIDVENPVDDLASVNGLRRSHFVGRRHQRLNQLPLHIREIAGIIAPFHGWLLAFLWSGKAGA